MNARITLNELWDNSRGVIRLNGDAEVSFTPGPSPGLVSLVLTLHDPDTFLAVSLSWNDLKRILSAALATGLTLAQFAGVLGRKE